MDWDKFIETEKRNRTPSVEDAVAKIKVGLDDISARWLDVCVQAHTTFQSIASIKQYVMIDFSNQMRQPKGDETFHVSLILWGSVKWISYSRARNLLYSGRQIATDTGITTFETADDIVKFVIKRGVTYGWMK